MSIAVKPLANAVAGTDFIVAILDNSVTEKNFSAVTYNVAPTLPALGASNYAIGIQANGETGFPQLASLTAVSAFDGTNTQLGQLKVALAPAAGDVVNASSPMTYTYSAQALAITATTATG